MAMMGAPAYPPRYMLGATEAQLLETVRDNVHWPIDMTLSPPALWHLERAVRDYLDDGPDDGAQGKARLELTNVANAARALLQHIANDAREATTELTNKDLLS